jgi:hypothetical protein
VTSVLTTVEGIVRDGKVELAELPPAAEGAHVLVTFLTNPVDVDLRERGIGEAEAADLRWRLQSIAEDWDRPEMAVYDEL